MANAYHAVNDVAIGRARRGKTAEAVYAIGIGKTTTPSAEATATPPDQEGS